MNKRTFSTPMMQQYAEIKDKYSDCLLFFRLGDFYELFMEDAKIGADELDITLTKRPRGKDGHIPMAGVPYHVADTYVARLVKAGHKVAICEQVSEPDGKGIVERDVVRVVTPGTLMDEKSLDKREFNYTMSLSLTGNSAGIAVADISTGDFRTTEQTELSHIEGFLSQEIARFQPKEIILNETLYNDPKLLKFITNTNDLNAYRFPLWESIESRAEQYLRDHFSVQSLTIFGLEHKQHAQVASAVLLSYLEENQKKKVNHIRSIKTYVPENSVILDASTIKNLELFETIHDRKRKNTLIHTIDHTVTAMGGRTIREWIKKPLITKRDIHKRLDAVEELTNAMHSVKKLRTTLQHIYDVERVTSRLAVGIGNPVDLIHLRDSFSAALDLKKQIQKYESKLIRSLSRSISTKINRVITTIENTIDDDPPFDPKSGGLIKEGINTELDMLRNEILDSKIWIAELEEIERQKTGIGSLKVRFNKVFGYYIEVSKTQSEHVPKRYVRKQTLVNSERYITDELKKHEDKVLSSEEKINELEYRIFCETIDAILDNLDEIKQLSQSVAAIDCLANLAFVAKTNRYSRPTIETKSGISITDGRHPVVETTVDTFVPNTYISDKREGQIAIITGPNMSGKSVFIRQIALITLLAHIGSFVPAKSASIGIVDRIFVRSGASDVITAGLSTFMLEMVETAYILNHATDKSIIVMDEVGRGTSTYDGISLAWAIVEHLVNESSISALTLFATHYHELTELVTYHPDKVRNYSLAVDEKAGKPVFLYTLVNRSAPTSFGIEVAELAGMPKSVIKQAKMKLATLAEKNIQSESNLHNNGLDLSKIDPDNLTPKEALSLLYEITEKNS